jgi:hypothetical protein
LEVAFSVGSTLRLYSKDSEDPRPAELSSVGRIFADSNDVSMKDEESPAVGSITRQQLLEIVTV